MPVFYPNPPTVLDADGTATIPFVIRRDPVRPVILVTMRGFWDIATVDAYTAALDTAVVGASTRRVPFGILIDCADYPVQSAEATQRFREWYVTWSAPYRDDVAGIAIIAASVLNKIQAQRAFGSEVAVFLDRAPAATWLDERTAKAGATRDYISPR